MNVTMLYSYVRTEFVNQHIPVLQIGQQYSIGLGKRYESKDCFNLSKCYEKAF